MKPAPVAIFVYNRPEHTARMLDSLLQNQAALNSDITVYSDGPRANDCPGGIDEVRHLVTQKLPRATLKTSDKNMGLARSIINGVTEQCELHGRVIVIEDDLVLSPSFLEYMNAALAYYEHNTRVMHISAYVPPVPAALPATFFFREPNSFGWATWKRAWDYFEKDSRKLALDILQAGRTSAFNQAHSAPFWEMLCRQYMGEVDSWAIRWHATLFQHDGLALYPGASLVNNTGFDGSGAHCPVDDKYEVEVSSILPRFTDQIVEDMDYLAALKRFRLNGKWHQFSRFIKHHARRRKFMSELQQQKTNI